MTKQPTIREQGRRSAMNSLPGYYLHISYQRGQEAQATAMAKAAAKAAGYETESRKDRAFGWPVRQDDGSMTRAFWFYNNRR